MLDTCYAISRYVMLFHIQYVFYMFYFTSIFIILYFICSILIYDVMNKVFSINQSINQSTIRRLESHLNDVNGLDVHHSQNHCLVLS